MRSDHLRHYIVAIRVRLDRDHHGHPHRVHVGLSRERLRQNVRLVSVGLYPLGFCVVDNHVVAQMLFVFLVRQCDNYQNVSKNAPIAVNSRGESLTRYILRSAFHSRFKLVSACYKRCKTGLKRIGIGSTQIPSSGAGSNRFPVFRASIRRFHPHPVSYSLLFAQYQLGFFSFRLGGKLTEKAWLVLRTLLSLL